MKLKKIASLALAGVMAVSMLTACGDANNIDDTQKPNEPDTTPATGYSAIFESRLSAKGQANIDMSDSDALNTALKDAMKFASDAVIADRYDNQFNDGMAYFVNHNSGTSIGQVAIELINAADSEKESLKKNTEEETVQLLNPYLNEATIKHDKKDADIVMLYIVTGLGTDAAVKEVADELDVDISNLVRVYNSNGADKTGETMYNYTGSVSADTITLDADHGKSMTFVAVEIVRELV